MFYVTTGTRQSGDVMIRMSSHPRREVKVFSPVIDLVGGALRALADEAVDRAELTEILVEVHDNAASDWVVRARLHTAVRRWRSAHVEEDVMVGPSVNGRQSSRSMVGDQK